MLGVCRLIDLVSRRTIDHLSVSFTESKVLTWSLFSTAPLNIAQSLNHVRIEARTDGLLEIGSDKTHF